MDILSSLETSKQRTRTVPLPASLPQRHRYQPPSCVLRYLEPQISVTRRTFYYDFSSWKMNSDPHRPLFPIADIAEIAAKYSTPTGYQPSTYTAHLRSSLGVGLSGEADTSRLRKVIIGDWRLTGWNVPSQPTFSCTTNIPHSFHQPPRMTSR